MCIINFAAVLKEDNICLEHPFGDKHVDVVFAWFGLCIATVDLSTFNSIILTHYPFLTPG